MAIDPANVIPAPVAPAPPPSGASAQRGINPANVEPLTAAHLNAPHPASGLPLWEHLADQEINAQPYADKPAQRAILTKWQTAAQGPLGLERPNPAFEGGVPGLRYLASPTIPETGAAGQVSPAYAEQVDQNLSTGQRALELGTAGLKGFGRAGTAPLALAAPSFVAGVNRRLESEVPQADTIGNTIAGGVGAAAPLALAALTPAGPGAVAGLGGASAAGGTRAEIAGLRAGGQDVSAGQEIAGTVGSGALGAAEGYGAGKLIGGAGGVARRLAPSLLRIPAAVGVDVAGNAALGAAGHVAENVLAGQTYDPGRTATQGTGKALLEGAAGGLAFAPASVAHGESAIGAEHAAAAHQRVADALGLPPDKVMLTGPVGGRAGLAAREIAVAATGQEPVWFHADSPRQAFLHPDDGRMYLNASSPQMAGEEAFHALWRGPLRGELEQFAGEHPDLVTRAADDYADRAGRAGEPAIARRARGDVDAHQDEGIANLGGDALDGPAVEKLARENPGLFMRLYDRVVGAIDQVGNTDQRGRRIVERQYRQFIRPLRDNLDVARAALGERERSGILADEARLDQQEHATPAGEDRPATAAPGGAPPADRRAIDEEEALLDRLDDQLGRAAKVDRTPARPERPALGQRASDELQVRPEDVAPLDEAEHARRVASGLAAEAPEFREEDEAARRTASAAARSPESLRAMSGRQLERVAGALGVHFDAPSTTIPRILDAQEELRLQGMSSKQLWDEVRRRGLRAGSREQNLRTLLADRQVEPSTESLKGAPNAVREQRPAEVLQRQPGETGGPGGERAGVEPVEQGQAPPRARDRRGPAPAPPEGEGERPGGAGSQSAAGGAPQGQAEPGPAAGPAAAAAPVKPTSAQRRAARSAAKEPAAAPPPGFSRAAVERKLLAWHEASPDYQAGVEQAYADESRAEETAGAEGVFRGSIPAEVRDLLTPEEFRQARRLRILRTAQGKEHAGGADALGNLGDDGYAAMIQRRLAANVGRDTALARAKEAAASSDDPAAQFLAKVHDALSGPAKDRTPFAATDAAQIPAGARFEFQGERFRVVEDDSGAKILKDGGDFPEVPLEWLDKVPVDKGTMTAGETPLAPKASAEIASGGKPESMGLDALSGAERENIISLLIPKAAEAASVRQGGDGLQHVFARVPNPDGIGIREQEIGNGWSPKDAVELKRRINYSEDYKKPSAPTSDTGVFGQTIFRPATGKQQGGLFHEPTEAPARSAESAQDARIRGKFGEGEAATGSMFGSAKPREIIPNSIHGATVGEETTSRGLTMIPVTLGGRELTVEQERPGGKSWRVREGKRVVAGAMGRDDAIAEARGRLGDRAAAAENKPTEPTSLRDLPDDEIPFGIGGKPAAEPKGTDVPDTDTKPAEEKPAEEPGTPLVRRAIETATRTARAVRDYATLDPVPLIARHAGDEAADAAVRHASAKLAAPRIVDDLIARVLPEDYKNPEVSGRLARVLLENRYLGAYDRFKKLATDLAARAHEATPAESDRLAMRAQEYRNRAEDIWGKHNLNAYDRDVLEALADPKMKGAIDRYQEHVGNFMNDLYKEVKGAGEDPSFMAPRQGRHFDAYLPIDPEVEGELSAEHDQVHEYLPPNNVLNPSVRRDRFDRPAGYLSAFGTDLHALMSAVIGPRWNEATKIRFYKALQRSGAAVEATTEAGKPAQLQGQPVATMDLRLPRYDPETNRTTLPERKLYVRSDLVRETRDVLNTDLPLPDNPVAKALIGVQLFQLADAVTHAKNLASRVYMSQGAGSPAWDVVKANPLVGIPSTVGKLYSAWREISADTPQTRKELSFLAQNGMLRGEYQPSELLGKAADMTGWQWMRRLSSGEMLHHVDAAARLILSRQYDELVGQGRAEDSIASRREFVNTVGNYNRRLMGPLMRAAAQSGLSPFIVAGRTFNTNARALLTGDPRFAGGGRQARMVQLGMLAAIGLTAPLVNMITTGTPGGRSGTPLGAIDLGADEKDGAHGVWDVLQIAGIRRGLRATGVDAVAEGLRDGKDANAIAGDALAGGAQSALHPWLGPAAGFGYKVLTGRQLDVRGKMEAQTIPEGGAKQYLENLRAALESQNPLVYALTRPAFQAAGLDQKPVDEERGYVSGIASTALKSPFGAAGVKSVRPGQTAAEDLAQKLVKLRTGGNESMTPEDAGKFAARAHLGGLLKDDPEAGESAIEDAVGQGKISERVAANLHAKAGMSPLAWHVRSLSAPDAAKVYREGTDQEKAALADTVRGKILQSRELSDQQQDDLLSELGIDPPADLQQAREEKTLSARDRAYQQARKGGNNQARRASRLTQSERSRLSSLRAARRTRGRP